MAGEEHLKQGGAPDDTGVEGHSDHLGVAGALAAHLLVGGIVHVATRVAGNHLADASESFQRALDAPEAASSEDHVLHRITCGSSAPRG